MFKDFPDILSVGDLQKALGVGRTKAYSLVRSGQIASVKIGASIKIPKKMLVEYLKNVGYNEAGTDERPYTEGGTYERNG